MTKNKAARATLADMEQAVERHRRTNPPAPVVLPIPTGRGRRPNPTGRPTRWELQTAVAAHDWTPYPTGMWLVVFRPNPDGTVTDFVCCPMPPEYADSLRASGFEIPTGRNVFKMGSFIV